MFIFARSISKPITTLKDAANKIAKGIFDIDIQVPFKGCGDDEIADLALRFNEMKENLSKYTKQIESTVMELEQKDKDLKEANQELVKSELLKDEFISMVSHELKTPLAPIKMYSEMFLMPKVMGQLNQKQTKAIQSIIRSVEKLELLVNDVLDVYKLNMGQLKLSKHDVDISDLISQNISELRSFASNKHIDIKPDVRTSGTILCDQRRIDQVLANLIKNSIDFVPEKDGRIIVRAEKSSDSEIVFTVEDNGIGIPMEKVNNLFTKFYQIDTGVSRKHGGTGLGLVICKGIVEAHGGKIWVDRDYTKGTAIKFTLPRSSTSSSDTINGVYTITDIKSNNRQKDINNRDQIIEGNGSRKYNGSQSASSNIDRSVTLDMMPRYKF